MKVFFTYINIILAIALLPKPAEAQQWDGLTLYSNMGSTAGYLIDTASTVVKQWTFTGNTGYSTHMMPGGNIVRSVANMGNVLTGGGITGRLQKIDYNGNILWDWTYSSSTYVIHHDHCVLPNGNILVISYDVKTAADVAAAGGTLNSVVWSEKIMEIEPVGTNQVNVVWEWKLWDHLVQNVDANKANYQSSIVNNPQLMNINYALQKDWMHMNGVDYNPALNQIVFSSHNLNSWFVIDHSTTTAEAAGHTGGHAGKGGDFLFRWGNPASYQASGTKIFDVTHDAHWIPEDCPNGGNLSGINNRGQTSPSIRTTADQVIIPRVGLNYTLTPGSAYTPSTYSARKVGTGYTTNMGNVQEFPNGNHMMCLATVGSIIELDAAGNVLWSKSTSGTTPQAHRYSLCYINNVVPAQPTISVANASVFTCTQADTYQWYLNGTAVSGATLQTYTATTAGYYTVRITQTPSCEDRFASAVQYTVEAPPPVDLTGIATVSLLAETSLYPNPTNNILNIVVPASIENYTVKIFSQTGDLLIAEKNVASVELGTLADGLYIVNISAEAGQSINKKITVLK